MSEKIKKVEILPGCVSCGACQNTCPKVFKVNGISKVIDGVDLDKNEKCIREAADICPVQVIKITEK